jgi:hypothetical protein
MTEHGFIRAVHARLSPSLFRWKICDKFAGGVPDAFYAGPAGTLFVEYKYLKALPKRNNTAVNTCLTPQQILWLNTMHKFNHPVALVIGVADQAVILTCGAWNSVLSKQQFQQLAIPKNDVAVWIEQACLKKKTYAMNLKNDFEVKP